MTISRFAVGTLWLAASLAVSAQTISTYAGNDAIFSGNGQQAAAVQIIAPRGVVADRQGNFYVSAPGQSMVFKVAASGTIAVVAGTGLMGWVGDGGPAVAAELNWPTGLALDSKGNLYIADSDNGKIRKVDAATGIITTVAGNSAPGTSGDGGPATSAAVNDPVALAVDASGNIFIAQNDEYIRKVAPDGTISTYAGTGADGYTGDGGPATKATFSRPAGLALDAAGNLYVADCYSYAIRKITPAGIITTVAGGAYGYSGDGGPATKAALGMTLGVTLDASGALYISDGSTERIRRVDTNGIISTVAGTGTAGFSGDGGAAAAAEISTPWGITVDSTGAVVFVDSDNNRVRRFPVGGSIGTAAGSKLTLGDGGPARLGVVTNPTALATDASGNLYVAVASQNRIRMVTPGGVIGTVAGNGITGYGGDGGPATAAPLTMPLGVATDSSGNLFIAEGNEIRRVDATTGKLSTFAGPGGGCYSGNGTGGDGGPATKACLYYPTRVAVDKSGNVYFDDRVELPNNVTQGARIRRVTTDGTIHTYVGAGLGFGGDGGPAIDALIGTNLNFAVAADGTLYIADADNNRVRKVDPSTGIITTVAGNGSGGNSGDGGPAASAGLAGPSSLAFDKSGNLYIGCSAAVRMMTPGGTIGTVVGNGQFNFGGDGGPATAASLQLVTGLALDSAGDMFIADSMNNRVRVVRPAAGLLTVSPVSLNFTSGGSQTFTVTASGSGTLAWAAAASTTSGGSWLTATPASGSLTAGQTGATVTVTVSTSGLAAGDYYGSIEVTSAGTTNTMATATVHLTVGGGTAAAAPAVAAGGVLSAATYSLNAPVAPGMLVSIFGSNFTAAGSQYVVSTFPWPTEVGGTSVTIGGEPVPLYVVTPGQINAMIPYDVAVNTTLPLVVTYNGAVSPPEPVSLAPSEPGIFTSSMNGMGTGIVVIAHSDGSQVLAGNGNAAKAGDVLVIYGTGLGTVTPRAVAGAPAPLSQLEWADDPVTVTIGGVKASGILFDGAAPGWSGLYQVNVTVPAGIAASSQAPLVLTQSGRSSPAAVTIPIQ